MSAYIESFINLIGRSDGSAIDRTTLQKQTIDEQSVHSELHHSPQNILQQAYFYHHTLHICISLDRNAENTSLVNLTFGKFCGYERKNVSDCNVSAAVNEIEQHRFHRSILDGNRVSPITIANNFHTWLTDDNQWPEVAPQRFRLILLGMFFLSAQSVLEPLYQQSPPIRLHPQQRFTFFLAWHYRCGTESPANELPQLVHQTISEMTYKLTYNEVLEKYFEHLGDNYDPDAAMACANSLMRHLNNIANGTVAINDTAEQAAAEQAALNTPIL